MSEKTIYGVKMRKRWYYLVERDGKSVSEVCRFFGIPRKTYYSWYKKDHCDKTYIPKKEQPALKMTQEIKEFVESEKLQYNYGPEKMKIRIKEVFTVNISTTVIYRFYKKKGLIRKPQKRLPFYRPLKSKVTPSCPGGVVQLDIKYIWTPQGFQYQRTFLDVYSREQYAVEHPTKEARYTIEALVQAQEYFDFEIVGIQTDNGGEFRGVFHQYLKEQGIVHFFIPKGSPQWNGCVERAHRSIDDEYYKLPESPHETIEEYLLWYNTERPHLGKGMDGMTPEKKLLEYKKSVTPKC